MTYFRTIIFLFVTGLSLLLLFLQIQISQLGFEDCDKKNLPPFFQIFENGKFSRFALKVFPCWGKTAMSK